MSRIFRAWIVLAVLLAGCQAEKPTESAQTPTHGTAEDQEVQRLVARCTPLYQVEPAFLVGEADSIAAIANKEGLPTTRQEVLEALAAIPPKASGEPRDVEMMLLLYLVCRRPDHTHTDAVVDMQRHIAD